MRRKILLASMILAPHLTHAQSISYDFTATVDVAGTDNFCAQQGQTITGTVSWDTGAALEYSDEWGAEYRDNSPTSTLTVNCPDGNQIQVDEISNPKLYIRVDQGGSTDFWADSHRGTTIGHSGDSQYSIDHMLLHYYTPGGNSTGFPIPTSLPSVDPNYPMQFYMGYINAGSFAHLGATVTSLSPSDGSCSAAPQAKPESVSYAFTASINETSTGLGCVQPGQQVTGTLTYSPLATWYSGDSQFASYRDTHTSSTLTVNCADGSTVTVDPASSPRLMIDVDVYGFLGFHADNYMGATLRHDAGTDGSPEMFHLSFMGQPADNTEIPASIPNLANLQHADIYLNWAYQPTTGLSHWMSGNITSLSKISNGPIITAPAAEVDITIINPAPAPLSPLGGPVHLDYELLPSPQMNQPSEIKHWITVLRPDGVEVPWKPTMMHWMDPAHPPLLFSEPIHIEPQEPAGVYTLRMHVLQASNQGYSVQELTVEKLQ